MSDLGEYNFSSTNKAWRFIIEAFIKFKVRFCMLFVSKVSVEIENIDVETIETLEKWASHHHYSFKAETVKHHLFIYGQHYTYDTNSYENRTKLVFFK